MWARLALPVILSGGLLWAEAPSTSIRPAPRPGTEAIAAPPPPETQTAAPLPVPKPRPPSLTPSAEAPAEPQTAAQAVVAPSTIPSVRPKPRPPGLIAAAVAAPSVQAPAAKGTSKKSRKGSVCGDPAIKGEEVAAIPAKSKGCGLAEPVRVSSVAGVALSPAAIISCDTAEALKQWVETGVQPAFGNREVVELRVAASYICRTRNNVKGAKVSEHGRGKAIDISGFVMSDGKLWTVAGNYNSTIRKAHKAACGIFGTTLGPGSDGYHEDHLHFDIARYNSGPYCR